MKWYKKFGAFLSVVLLASSLCLQSASAAYSNLPFGLPPDAYPVTSSQNQPSPLSLGDYTIKQIKGSLNFSQQCGGFYYAYGPMSNAYQSTYANILLPTGLNRANNTRNAYISMGILGSDHSIDLGICNRGNGWVPYYYEKGSEFTEEISTYAAPASAVSAQITVKPINTTTVQLYVQWKNASDNNVGVTYNKQISVASGNLKMVGGKVQCRFYRFASLVNAISQDNQGDGSYMTGGAFRYCQLYNGSNYVSWGIGTSTVTDCFLVSPSHTTLSYSGQNDTFNIRHNG